MGDNETQARTVAIREEWNESVSPQSCPTLCDSMDRSPSDYSVHGIFQARVLEWITIPFSKASSQPRDRTQVSCAAGRFFTIWATKETQSESVWLEKRGWSLEVLWREIWKSGPTLALAPALSPPGIQTMRQNRTKEGLRFRIKSLGLETEFEEEEWKKWGTQPTFSKPFGLVLNLSSPPKQNLR